MNIVVAQIGARRHYAVPVAFHNADMLHAVYTDWCANRGLGAWATTLLPQSLFGRPLARIRDRRIPAVSGDQVKTFDRHALRTVMGRSRQKQDSQYAHWARANRDFGEAVVQHGFEGADAVYGFNAAAVEIFQQARKQGLRTVLDQTMAPWEYVETVLGEERERWPDWEEPQPDERWRLLADREAEEWELAETIICGSEFVVESLRATGGPAERCRVVPYGYDAPDVAPDVVPDTGRPAEQRPATQRPTGQYAGGERLHRPLRVLFVGTVELRKGVPYLLEAARQLGPTRVEVRGVGPIRVKEAAVQTLRQHVELVGPVSRSDVHQHYQWADVFVLPTLAEGSANVCYEAMSHALPVITTPNAGSVVRDQVDGFIIAPRSSDELAGCLSRLVDDEPLRRSLSASAASRSAEFSWNRYYKQLPATVREALATTPLSAEPVIS